MSEVNASAHATAASKKPTSERIEEVKAAGGPVSVVPPYVVASLLEIAETAPEGGCFVEVGVYRGGTAFHLAKIARSTGRGLFLFDTFEGIPYRNAEKGDAHKVGDFNDTSYEEVVEAIPDAVVVKGVFPDTMQCVNLPPVAFAHIDADQYDSIVNAMKALSPHMMKGGIVVFDDYGCLEGATRAVLDLYGEDRIELTSVGKAMVRY